MPDTCFQPTRVSEETGEVVTKTSSRSGGFQAGQMRVMGGGSPTIVSQGLSTSVGLVAFTR